jgi:protein gp37
MMEQQIITQEDLADLEHAEAAISRAMKNAFEEVGAQLDHINGRGLYSLRKPTFAQYVEAYWEMSEQRAYQLIAAWKAYTQLNSTLVEESSTIVELPARETHIRPLLTLKEPEDRAIVWANVLASANGQGITAQMVKDEVAQFKAAQDKNWITLSEWDEGERWHGAAGTSTMNKVNDNIEWAAWSWNPVTGCLHNCDYCYARDMANRIYPQKFEPSFIPARLTMPDNTKPLRPRWDGDTGHRNVFTCSMADLFGKWVPTEWVEAVLESIRRNSQWTFLLLTKFPIRMAEFDYPPNVWLGTTVDYQHAIHRAQQGFRKIKASGFEGVCWLSCEPMMERLTFDGLDMFDWLVVGGSSRSTQTPEYRPPFSDIVHLYQQAKHLDLPVYMKTNLIPGMGDEQRIREYPGEADGL